MDSSIAKSYLALSTITLFIIQRIISKCTLAMPFGMYSYLVYSGTPLR